MSAPERLQAIYGTIIHSPNPSTIEILPSTLLTLSPTGQITSVQPDASPDAISAADRDSALLRLSPAQFLVPGFIDTHNHAPQHTQRGLGQGMHILDWLSGITFPNEAKFQSADHARRVYGDLVRSMLRQGVTTASYYGSLHGEASRILAETCLARGQRALVGKCNMDRNSPDIYREESAAASLKETEACIAHIRRLDPSGSQIRPVLTPRFAISCTDELLAGLGEIAQREPEIPIQTHFNEAQQEIDFTLALFPAFKSEVDLYRHFRLLEPRSILAHCTIMRPEETDALHELDCGIAHCPIANMTVGGGFMAADVKNWLGKGMKVGLGTDVGGGFAAGILETMRAALIASFARDALYDKDGPAVASTTPKEETTHGQEEGAEEENKYKVAGLNIDDVFYMATMGGARVVGKEKELGSFSEGKAFDALLVDMGSERNGINAPIEDGDSTRIVFEKFIMTGDDRNIAQVYIDGKKVHSN